MSKEPSINKSIDKINEEAKKVLKEILSKRVVTALLTQVKEEKGMIRRVLVTKESEIENIDLFTPVIPGFSVATYLSELTKDNPLPKPLGVTAKPCEVKAVIELTKLEQIKLENVVLIGTDCYGTFHVLKFKEMVEKGENPNQKFYDSFLRREENRDFRTYCKICASPTPENTDINLGYIGKSSKLYIEAKSEKGKIILAKIGLTANRDKEREEAITEIIKERERKYNEFVLKSREEVKGVEGLREIFKDCIKCQNCMEACPICFCKECFFDSQDYDFVFNKYLKWTVEEGTTPSIKAKIQFHLGRMLHMGISCIDCGLCEQACPKDIELSKVFTVITNEARKEFNYQPGRKIDEPVPLIYAEEEELEEFLKSP